MKSHEWLGLLHSDGSLTVYPPNIGIVQARREALDCDENQDNAAFFTKVVSLRVEDIDVLEVPSLRAAPKNSAKRQSRRSRDPVA